MAKILLSFGNAVLSEQNPHALPCFYESFAKSLVNVGNEVLIWHSFGPSQAIASAHQEKIIAGIKDFSPELIVAFNNYGLNWAKWFDCPILIYEVDSPLYYENVRAIREHPDRYKYIVCQETSRDILTKQLNVPKSFVDIAPFFTEVQAHELPIERNIAFIGSRFGELTFHWQRCLNSKEKYLPEFRRRYVSALDYIRKNVFADAEDIIAKFSDLSLTREDVDDILSSLSAEKRIEVLTIIGPGDEIIVPTNTFIATILAISENGCTPVLVEPDIETYCIDPEKIEAAITPKTKVVMVVHLYGQAVPMEKIWALQTKYGFKIIVDATQAHGAIYQGRRTGNLGDAAGFSFYPGKNLGAMGDAGGVTTNDLDVLEKVKAIGNYGSDRKYHHVFKGVNSRLDEIQAAILDVKLKHLDADNARRREIAKFYREHITNPRITLPKVYDEMAHVWHLFVIRCDDRDGLAKHLEENGIQTNIHYPTPPHLQGAYKEWASLSYPITEKIHREVLSLPISPAMTDENVTEIVETLNAWQ